MQEVLKDLTVFRSADMSEPSQSTLSEEGVYRGGTCSFEYNAIGDLIRPRNGQDTAKAYHMEGAQALLVPGIGGSGGYLPRRFAVWQISSTTDLHYGE